MLKTRFWTKRHAVTELRQSRKRCQLTRKRERKFLETVISNCKGRISLLLRFTFSKLFIYFPSVLSVLYFAIYCEKKPWWLWWLEGDNVPLSVADCKKFCEESEVGLAECKKLCESAVAPCVYFHSDTYRWLTWCFASAKLCKPPNLRYKVETC